MAVADGPVAILAPMRINVRDTMVVMMIAFDGACVCGEEMANAKKNPNLPQCTHTRASWAALQSKNPTHCYRYTYGCCRCLRAERARVETRSRLDRIGSDRIGSDPIPSQLSPAHSQ